MKKLGSFLVLTLTLATTLTTAFGANPASASTNDFYFANTTFDYYLEKLPDNRSKMHVVEELTAVFPSYNQNHGIERCIPKKYNGTSILPNPNFTVTRNGISEPFSTYNDGKFLCLRIGNANQYVHDEQTYIIAYDVENVILNPANATGQELYWDINGTGWSQSFESIIARVHLPTTLNNARKSQNTDHLSCYVGIYGISGSDATSRCTIRQDFISDTEYSTVLIFSASNLRAAEGMTINIEFLPDTFFVKGPDPSFALLAVIGIIALVSAFLIYKWAKAEQKIKDKKTLAKDPAVPVQYTPPKDLTVAEAGTIWLKSARSLQVATLMQLAVQHDIALEKGEKKRFGGYHWKVHIKRTEHLTAEQRIVLEILNGGASVHDGDVIEIKRRTSTSHLEKLGRDFPKKIEGNLRGKQLYEPEKPSKISSGVVVLAICFISFVGIPLCISLLELLAPLDDTGLAIPVLVVSIFIIATAAATIASILYKYQTRTLKGIKTSKYLDGLKEYMKLAETDRLKFLQSVKGIDTSHQGIVKLYEKLLPYAVIFGIEESWMNEHNKYYQLDDVANPYWLHGTTYLPISDFRSFSSYTSSSISSATASSDSGGSSGGGGGGFSGGGGGGGGGGGW
ncbi:DUF2207 domain-containing protein [Candidatus Saccharibacteria bacterium]|nr:DUF2207 domain-containing protein [Candidatus Saccharibacteria bacterium]